MAVRITLNRTAVAQVVGPMADKAAYRAAQRVRGYAMQGIQQAGRIDTGKMIAGLQVRKLTGSSLVVAYQVYSSAPYTRFQEEGTRAHGPKVAPMLVFRPKGSSGLVFAKWVRGVTGAHFMKNAVAKVTVGDFTG